MMADKTVYVTITGKQKGKTRDKKSYGFPISGITVYDMAVQLAEIEGKQRNLTGEQVIELLWRDKFVKLKKDTCKNEEVDHD